MWGLESHFDHKEPIFFPARVHAPIPSIFQQFHVVCESFGLHLPFLIPMVAQRGAASSERVSVALDYEDYLFQPFRHQLYHIQHLDRTAARFTLGWASFISLRNNLLIDHIPSGKQVFPDSAHISNVCTDDPDTNQHGKENRGKLEPTQQCATAPEELKRRPRIGRRWIGDKNEKGPRDIKHDPQINDRSHNKGYAKQIENGR
jgi:hypothetical protein